MPARESNTLTVPHELACGVAAGPLFAGGFVAIGARRAGYDWLRHAVSSLAAGRGGWPQRSNFMLTGALYCIAAHGLARNRIQTGLPRVVPALLYGVGAGLVGSGVFVTDPVAGFPPSDDHAEAARSPRTGPTLHGELHNFCAIPIFAGIPLAAMTCAMAAARSADYRWALYSAGSGVAMPGAFVLFRSRVWRGAEPHRDGRSVAARVGRDRVRMAERAVASSADVVPHRVLGLTPPDPAGVARRGPVARPASVAARDFSGRARRSRLARQ